MDKKTKIIIGIIVVATFFIWVWVTYSIQMASFKPNNAYKNAISKYNYEIARVNSENLKEKDVYQYRQAYYNRGNFLCKSARCSEAIADLNIALEDCGWEIYEGVCKFSPGYIKRGNCHFKSFQIKAFLKDYYKFFSMHIFRTIAFVTVATFTFTMKHILMAGPIIIVIMLFFYNRYKNREKLREKHKKEETKKITLEDLK